MRIGLIDVDGHNFPNVALMKLSSWHKQQGDIVEWAVRKKTIVQGDLFGTNEYECISVHYDRIYASKVFTFSPNFDKSKYSASEYVLGGTGYDIGKKLPPEIDTHTGLDYSLYPQYNFSVQFFSRGCIRRCPFCLVHDKEGGIQPVQPMQLNPRGEWIEVLDNNFFANPEWRSAVEYLKKQKMPIKLHGVDVRIMTEEMAAALNSLRLKTGKIHIAWDLPQIDLTEQLRTMVRFVKPYKITCYVLVGFNSTIEQDLFRLRTLKALGISPFVQPYRDYENNRVPTQYEKDISRWANRPWLFKSSDFLDYEPRKGFICKKYLDEKV